MPSLMDIGKSAINAQRQALNVTGQNIANVNTEGYRRRDADLKEVSGSQSELASKSAQIGLGVSLGEVRRAFNAYLAQSTNSAESKFQSASNFVNSLERLENLILPNEGDLSSQLTNFFGKISDISANPGDLAPRAAALEQGSALANAFNVTSHVIGELKAQLRHSVDEDVSALNRLTESLAMVNSRLRASNIGSAPPNALLDERDRLVTKISEKALVSVEYGARFEANLSFGRFTKGPALVIGEKATPVNVTHSDLSGSTFKLGDGMAFKSIDDGSIKGLSDSLSIIESTVEKLDNLAIRVVEELNSLHVSGIDYDGESGKELFTAKQFTVDQPQTNSKELDVTLLQVPGKIDAMSEMKFNYSAATDEWTATGSDGSIVGKGRREIDLDGMVLKINSVAKDGDVFNVSRMRGEATRIEFLLLDGREFAAAANFVITPASTNTGSATLTSETVEATPPDLNNILEITTNSISPVAFTEFRTGGVVGYIPAEVERFDLASFGQSPIIEYNFSSGEGLGSFNVVFGGTQYNFPSDQTKDILSPAADAGELSSHLSSDKIAQYLNNGVLKSTSGHTFRDLGLHAAGFEGGLKIAGKSEFTSGHFTTQTGSTSSGVVRSGIDSSGFRVFTREGRQIAGQPISSAEAGLLITEENGFQRNAVYRADYLNSFGGVGYRGAEITNLRPDGYHGLTSVTSIINGGDLTQLVKQNPALNSINNQSLEITTSDGLVSSNIDVNAGSSANEIARNLNISLMEMGFVAEAKTIASLQLAENANQNGSLQFSFDLEDGNSLAVNADYSSKNLSSLVSKVNQYFDRTGVRAELSNDGNRALLIEDEGNDIKLSNFSGSSLEVNALSQAYEKFLSTDVALNQATKIVGSVDLKSPREFNFKTSLGGSGLSSDSAMLSGGIGRTFSSGGTVADFEWQISPDLLAPQSSPDGLRLSTSSAVFQMTSALNGQRNGLDLTLNSSDLNDYSSTGISRALVDQARALGTVPSLTGSVLTALPPEGSSMSVLVGGSTYDITFKSGKLTVSGPENERILASLKHITTGYKNSVTVGYQISLDVPAGTMSGQSIEVLNNTDSAPFGLSSADASTETVLRGRSFSFENTAGQNASAGLGANKKYIINALGTSDFTTADAGDSLASALVGTIFTADGSSLTGTGRVNQVFTTDARANATAGDADFLNAIEVHSVSDLTSSDIGADWILSSPDDVLSVSSVASASSGGATNFSASVANNVITVTAANTAPGNVTVTIDGTAHTAALTLPVSSASLPSSGGATAFASTATDNVITVTAVPSANGNVTVKIDGTEYTAAITDTDWSAETTTTTAAKIAAALNALGSFPFTVTSSGAALTVAHTATSTASQLIAKLDAATGTSQFPYNLTDGGNGKITLSDGLSLGSKAELMHNGSNYLLNGQVLHSAVKLIPAGQKFEVVENGSASHPVGTYFTLNMNASGELVDEKGVAIAATLGVTKATVKAFEVKMGNSDATIEVANHRGQRYVLESSDDKLNFATNRGEAGVVSSLLGVSETGVIANATDLQNIGFANNIVASTSSGAGGIVAHATDNTLTVTSPVTSSGNVDVVVDGITYTIALTAAQSPTIAETGSQIKTLLSANSDFNLRYSASDDGNGIITLTPRDEKSVLTVESAATSAGKVEVIVDNRPYAVSLTLPVSSASLPSSGAATDFASTSADNVITVTAVPSANGNVTVKIDGTDYTAAITDTDWSAETTITSAAKIAAALNALGSFPFTVTTSGAAITVAHTATSTAGQLASKLSINPDFNQNYSATNDDDTKIIITPKDETLSVSKLIINPTINAPLVALTTSQTNGLISVVPSSNAKELGFQAGSFDFEISQDGFKVISTTADAVDINLDATDLPGQILSMKELPPEDLIVFLEKEGARRLGAQYELIALENQQNEERNYRVEMTDKNLGKIEVIDTDNGHSIATRFTSGVSEFDLGTFRLNLSGFADQGDYFEIGLNQSKPGDSRNAEAIVSLNKNTAERNSFQEDFRSIALSVGSQLVSGRMIEVSAISMRDAARFTEDELSGVNLDEEASRLMEQQQAYKAAAQILQAARQMFDTLVNIM